MISVLHSIYNTIFGITRLKALYSISADIGIENPQGEPLFPIDFYQRATSLVTHWAGLLANNSISPLTMKVIRLLCLFLKSC